MFSPSATVYKQHMDFIGLQCNTCNNIALHFSTSEEHILNKRSRKSSQIILEIKDPWHYLQKEDEKRGKEEKGHPGQHTDESWLPWFQSSCAWCCWTDGRQTAGCLTAADGAKHVFRNTQALSFAYMCHIIPVIIILFAQTHRLTCTHLHISHYSMGSCDWF